MLIFSVGRLSSTLGTRRETTAQLTLTLTPVKQTQLNVSLNAARLRSAECVPECNTPEII